MKRYIRFYSILFILPLLVSGFTPVTVWGSSTIADSGATQVTAAQSPSPMSTILPTTPVDSTAPISTILPTVPVASPASTAHPTPSAVPDATASVSPAVSSPMPSGIVPAATPVPSTEAGEPNGNPSTDLVHTNDSSALADLEHSSDSDALADLEYETDSAALGELEYASASDMLANAVLRVVVPTTLDFYMDPLNLSGKGTLFSPKYAIVNHSNVDIEFSISELYYRFSDNGKFLSCTEPPDKSIVREEKAVYMFLKNVSPPVFDASDHLTENNATAETATEAETAIGMDATTGIETEAELDTMSETIATNITEHIVTDKSEGSALTILLKAANYDEYGNFVSLNQGSSFLFTLTGDTSDGTSAPWQSGDMKIYMVYSWKVAGLKTEENPDSLAGATPTPSITPLPDGTPLPEETPTASETPLPGATPIPSGTPLPGATSLPSGTPSPGATPLPSGTPLPGTTPLPSGTPSLGTTPLPSGAPSPGAIPLPSGNPVAAETPAPATTPVPAPVSTPENIGTPPPAPAPPAAENPVPTVVPLSSEAPPPVSSVQSQNKTVSESDSAAESTGLNSYKNFKIN